VSILVWTIGLIILGIAAITWGGDSREDVNSSEWEHVAAWSGFNGARH